MGYEPGGDPPDPPIACGAKDAALALTLSLAGA